MTRIPLAVLFALLPLGACTSADKGAPDTGTDTDTDTDSDSDSDPLDEPDQDGDGYTSSGGDCDDGDPSIHPGATDTPYDGIDSDCDAWDDNDADHDGAADLAHGGDDCDDADPTMYPGADEVWDDGIDQDCDGYADASNATCTSSFSVTFPDGSVSSFDGCVAWSMDAGFEFDPDAPPQLVSLTATFSAWGDDAFDCAVTLELADICEPGVYEEGAGSALAWTTLDCSGTPDDWESTYAAITGWTEITALDTGTEAGNLSGRPLWTELSGTLFGQSDDDVTLEGSFSIGSEQIATDAENPGDCQVIDPDADADGHNDRAFGGDDCDDARADVGPDAEEVCDGVDNDCNGDVDEAGDPTFWYVDSDGDGAGEAGTALESCVSPGPGYALTDDDCDDTRATVYPGATEVVADGVDQDCDGGDSCLVDGDADAWGASTELPSADLDCADAGEAALPGDCDDADASVNPEVAEGAADGVDANCDSFELCFLDDDGDGHGGDGQTLSADLTCSDPGLAASERDCDDTDAAVNPDATETVDNATDDDCDGQERCYADADRDGHGGAAYTSSSDLDCTDAGEARSITDCDDSDAAVAPGAAEGVADGVDQDCDGAEDCYADLDGDGSGTATLVSSPDLTCVAAGESTDADDCDDADSAVSPTAAEQPANSVDDDCDGSEACYSDIDLDRHGTTTTVASADLDCLDANESLDALDCDDADAAVSPSDAEVRNDGVDQDCDGYEECPRDSDGDGSGSRYNTTLSADLTCTSAGAADNTEDCDDGDPASTLVSTDADCDGWITADDCDDTDDAVSPDATEVCYDGIDNDCDGAPSSSCVPYSGSLSTLGRTYSHTAGRLSTAGDVNADGYDDFLMGDTNNVGIGRLSYSGRTTLVYGGPTPDGSLTSAVTLDGTWLHRNGSSLAPAGDVDGDGYDDFLSGAILQKDHGRNDGGVAYLVLGGTSLASGYASSHIDYYGATCDEAGSAVDGGQDFDGDGLGDILVGAWAMSCGYGGFYLSLGTGTAAETDLSTQYRYHGVADNDYAGWSAAFVGDADGDGLTDIVAGAYGADTAGSAAGEVYLVLSSDPLGSATLSAFVTYTGEAAGDNAGGSVARADDVDGDGYSDFLVGASNNDDGGTDAGAVYLVRGSASPSSGSLSSAVQYTGTAAREYAGASVAGLGDVDRDGYPDFLIGAPGTDKAYFLSEAGAPAASGLGSFVTYSGTGMGDAVGRAGDVDGDGVPDMLVGGTNTSLILGGGL